MIEINFLYQFWKGCIRVKFLSNIGRDVYETCSVTYNMDTNSTFGLGPKKTLMELAGCRTFRVQTEF
jgi:hypothetical protein